MLYTKMAQDAMINVFAKQGAKFIKRDTDNAYFEVPKALVASGGIKLPNIKVLFTMLRLKLWVKMV